MHFSNRTLVHLIDYFTALLFASEQVQLYIPRKTSPQVQNLSLWSNEEFNDGVCVQVPSGVTLNIFYAEQGKVDGDPILQIIGAYARYFGLILLLPFSLL